MVRIFDPKGVGLLGHVGDHYVSSVGPHELITRHLRLLHLGHPARPKRSRLQSIVKPYYP